MSAAGLWAEMVEGEKEGFPPHSPVGKCPLTKSSGERERKAGGGGGGGAFSWFVLHRYPLCSSRTQAQPWVKAGMCRQKKIKNLGTTIVLVVPSVLTPLPP